MQNSISRTGGRPEQTSRGVLRLRPQQDIWATGQRHQDRGDPDRGARGAGCSRRLGLPTLHRHPHHRPAPRPHRYRALRLLQETASHKQRYGIHLQKHPYAKQSVDSVCGVVLNCAMNTAFTIGVFCVWVVLT